MTREELIEKVARALIDADPCIEGYHESHIRLKTPDAIAAIDIVLDAVNEATEGIDVAVTRAICALKGE